MEVWGNIVGKAKIMEDLPMWLQYYPKILFNIINQSGMYDTFNDFGYFRYKFHFFPFKQ